MAKKCLVFYSSVTGNTEKVALRFKSTFERSGWECDIVKIRKTAGDILNPPFDIRRYDFVCERTPGRCSSAFQRPKCSQSSP